MTTPKDTSSVWTLDSLERHMSLQIEAFKQLAQVRDDWDKARHEALKVSVKDAFAVADRAIIKAEQSTEKRFDAVNEFRAALQDQTAAFLPKTVYEVQHKSLTDKFALLETHMARTEAESKGKASGIGTVGAIVMSTILALSAVASIISLFVSLYARTPTP